ncbi:hypothetical protein [Aurantiacibacter zhengii]|uniref:hypothetical protein n=1 Tax=Aurantiacibacter zhengii TaxID=2307003 RepID=UPI0011C22609|nr:hypothetical protein [Aurantiacibacter zhengii]
MTIPFGMVSYRNLIIEGFCQTAMSSSGFLSRECLVRQMEKAKTGPVAENPLRGKKVVKAVA